MEDSGAFADKDTLELVIWLKSNGISQEICDCFEENEIDGVSFLELTEADIKSLVPKLGVVKKICRLQASVSKQGCSSTPTRVTSQSTSAFPLSPPQGSPMSSLGSPPSVCSPVDSDETCSIGSSASALTRKEFVLPDIWRPTIMACIRAATEEQKKMLTPAIRNEIVRDLVTQMYAIKLKPDRAFCTLVSKSLIKKYPFMKDTGDNVSGYGSWEKKLIERVHNVRSAQSRKRPPPDGEMSTPKKGRPKSSAVLNRYPPLEVSDFGNDDVSNARNLHLLQKEMERDKPRKDTILPLLRQTFASRREYILSEVEDVNVATILTVHPALKLPYVLEQEIDLILARKDVAKTSAKDWQTKWTPAILQHSATLVGKQGAIFKHNQKACQGHEEEDEKTAFLQLCTLMQKKGSGDSLLYVYEDLQMAEDPEEVCTRDPPRPAPRIACFAGEEGSTYFLFVESKVLCTTSSFPKALMLWFIAHYVFNLVYCKQVREVALFFQEFVFGLPEKSKGRGATYLTVTSDINKYI